MISVVTTFFAPTLWLVLEHPKVDAFLRERKKQMLTKIGLEDTEGTYIEVKDHCEELQLELVQLLSTSLTVTIFGALVPPLLLLSPLGVWLRLCALEWNVGHRTERFGRAVAVDVLVQQPVRLFHHLMHYGSWAIAAFIFVDLEYGLGWLPARCFHVSHMSCAQDQSLHTLCSLCCTSFSQTFFSNSAKQASAHACQKTTS